MAVIEQDVDDNDAAVVPQSFKKARASKPTRPSSTVKPVKPAKEGRPPAGRVKVTSISSGQKRKRPACSDSDVDSGLGNSKPKNSSIRHQQVMQANTDAHRGRNQKKRKQSLSPDHDSGFDEEYDSPANKSPQTNGGRHGDEERDDRDYKFVFNFESPAVAEVA